MARFHFTARDGVVSRDPKGVEFNDNASTGREAVCFLGERLRDHPDEFAEARQLEGTDANSDGSVMRVLAAQLKHRPGSADCLLLTPAGCLP